MRNHMEAMGIQLKLIKELAEKDGVNSKSTIKQLANIGLWHYEKTQKSTRIEELKVIKIDKKTHALIAQYEDDEHPTLLLSGSKQACEIHKKALNKGGK